MSYCDTSIWYHRLEPSWVCGKGENIEKDFWTDILLMLVLSIILSLLIFFTRRTFKHVEMRNIHNYIIYSSLFMCLILRMACVCYSVIMDKNKKVYDYSM